MIIEKSRNFENYSMSWQVVILKIESFGKSSRIESEYERKKQDFKITTTCKRSTRVKVSRKTITDTSGVASQYILKVTQMYR